MKVEKFEDLVAWQKARELTKQIYEITKQGAFSKDYGLCDQIRTFSKDYGLCDQIRRLSHLVDHVHPDPCRQKK